MTVSLLAMQVAVSNSVPADLRERWEAVHKDSAHSVPAAVMIPLRSTQCGGHMLSVNVAQRRPASFGGAAAVT